MSKIFGKGSSSTQQSTSNNQAFPQLSAGLTPQVDNGTGASNSIAALLGVGGDPAAQQAAFQQFRDSTGYQQQMDAGTQAITGGAASKGLLNSGSTAKALTGFGQGLANQSFKDFLNPLQSLVSSGNQAASVIGGAGQQSQSTQTSSGAKKGLFDYLSPSKLIGAGISGGASLFL